ncbi:MAG: hypothetical protein Q7R71_01365 [bacterium]|nr:hypothetical protein [bacterium]
MPDLFRNVPPALAWTSGIFVCVAVPAILLGLFHPWMSVELWVVVVWCGGMMMLGVAFFTMRRLEFFESFWIAIGTAVLFVSVAELVHFKLSIMPLLGIWVGIGVGVLTIMIHVIEGRKRGWMTWDNIVGV